MTTAEELRDQLGAYVAFKMDGWNQCIGAARIRIRQGELSELMRGNYRRFSIARLINIVARLDHEVELHVRPRNAPRPRTPPPTAALVVTDRVGQPVNVPQPRPTRRAPVAAD